MKLTFDEIFREITRKLEELHDRTRKNWWKPDGYCCEECGRCAGHVRLLCSLWQTLFVYQVIREWGGTWRYIIPRLSGDLAKIIWKIIGRIGK